MISPQEDSLSLFHDHLPRTLLTPTIGHLHTTQHNKMPIVNAGSPGSRLIYVDAPLPTITYARPHRPITHRNVAINLEEGRSYYTKQDTIEGSVVLKLEKDDKIKSIKVVLEGWCNTEGIAQHSGASLRDDWLAFVEKHRLVFEETTVFPPANVAQVKKQDTTFKVPRGNYEYPFSFKLPEYSQCGTGSTGGTHHQHALPLTYHMAYVTTEVEIEYRLHVTVDRVGFLSKDWFVSESINYLPLGPTPAQAHLLKRDKIKVTSDKITLRIPTNCAISIDKDLNGGYSDCELRDVEFYVGFMSPSKLVPGSTPNTRVFLLSAQQPASGKIQLHSLTLGLRCFFKFRAQSLGNGGYREISNDVNFFTLKHPITVDLAGLSRWNSFGELPFLSDEPLDYALELTSFLRRDNEVVNVEPTFDTCAFSTYHKFRVAASFRTFTEGVPVTKKFENVSQPVDVTSRTMANGWAEEENEQLPLYRRDLSPSPPCFFSIDHSVPEVES